jgi:hypothetical protein
MELLVPLITLYVGLALIRRWSAAPAPAPTPFRRPEVEAVPSVIRDTNHGFAQLQLPVGWRRAQALNEQAAVQISDAARQRFAVVISEAREDFDPTVDLSDHAARSLTQLSDSLRVLAINGPTERLVGGFRAVQFEVEGYDQGVRLVYLHTTIEGRRAIHQVLEWSTRSTYDRAVFDLLLDGFEELPGAEPNYPAAPPVMVQVETQSRYAFH